MSLEAEELTREIIGAAFEVYNHLGYGFLESVYQESMVVEVRARGLVVEPQAEIHVFYKGIEVGFYRADLFVERRVLVELKVAPEYCSSDEAQLLNELKATGVKVGLLINFGRTKVGFKRLVF
jgi:GxxExxY protein